MAARKLWLVEEDALEEAKVRLFYRAQRAQALEIASRIAEVPNPEYWRGLCPTMTISQMPTSEPSGQSLVDPEDFRRSGYFVAPDVLPNSQTAAIVEAIEQLRSRGWHPIFAFVFDELWNLAWATSVRKIGATLLGGPPRLLRGVAIHYIHEEWSRRGWAPHADYPICDDRVSFWIPLTDATTTNGCIYVIPRSDDVNEAVTRFLNSAATERDVHLLLWHARALPVSAGAVLGWAHGVLHWGSQWSELASPRISVACEWLGPGGAINNDHPKPLSLDDRLPTLIERLETIAWSILHYARNDMTLEPFAELAKRLHKVLSD